MKNFILTLSAFVVLCSALLLSGCSQQAETVTASEYRQVLDMSDTWVDVPNEPSRVICIQPTLTEYMVAFGLGETIIGVHSNSTNKVWADSLHPYITELQTYSYSPSAEEILESGADLVIVPSAETAESLRNAGITAVCIQLNDPDETYQHIRLLGEVFGDETLAKVELWIQEVEAVKEEIVAVLDENGVTEGPEVYMINGQSNKGLFYPQAGGGSALERYINDIYSTLSLADFDSSGAYPSQEEVLATNPQVITIGGVYAPAMIEELMSDSLWSEISAVVNDRVYAVPIGGIGWDQDYITLPILYKYYANIFYPELFDYELTEDIISFYSNYYGVTYSEQEVTNMLEGSTPDGVPAWVE